MTTRDARPGQASHRAPGAISMITPSQIAFHAAHKARLARIAAAATLHHERKLQAHARELTVRCERTRRRPYEVAGRAMEWMPLTRRILKAIASEYGLTIEDLTGQSRKGRVTHARHVAVGLIFEMTKLSYPAIGRRVGNRDHTTIINSVRQARKLFASEAFRNRIDQIKQEVT